MLDTIDSLNKLNENHEIHETSQEIKTLLSLNHKEQPKRNYLTATFELTLHTKLSEILFRGEWREGRIGLTQFASIMKNIWQAVKEDDPYAEWFLLKIYDAIEKAKVKIKNYETLLQQQMGQMRGFKIDLFKNPEPTQQPLNFATPFAYMGAMLVEHFDYVNRQLFTLQRIGVVAKNNLLPIHLLREVRRVFILSAQWKYTGVTRKDIAENNPKAQKAKKEFGEIPTAVLNKEVKFSFLPRKREEKTKQVV